MKTHPAIHSTFVIERHFPFSPARVFAAFADPKAKARWFHGPAEWDQVEYSLDFKVGGVERSGGGPKGGPQHLFEARYHDIVPDQRIVSAYQMWIDDAPMSVSLATTELVPDGRGTKLVYTEQSVYLDGRDGTRDREHGTRALYDQLEASLS